MPNTSELRALIEELRGVAGIGAGADSLEVFLLFPDEFRRRYAEMTARALRAAVEDTQGRLAEKEGQVGRARVGSEHKGKKVGAGAGGAGKRYRNFWVVKDENALRVKVRVDRKLRGLAREIADGMGVLRDDGTTPAGVGGEGTASCGNCGRFTAREWVYCPTCGYELKPIVRYEGLVDDMT